MTGPEAEAAGAAEYARVTEMLDHGLDADLLRAAQARLSNRKHTHRCGRTGRKDCVVPNCRMDCPCWCHVALDLDAMELTNEEYGRVQVLAEFCGWMRSEMASIPGDSRQANELLARYIAAQRRR